MKRFLVISALVLLAGCGGTKINLNNGTGIDLETVTLSVGESTETWHNIARDETFGSSLAVSGNSIPVVVTWEANGETWSMDNLLIDTAGEAKKISILFAPDELSINYSF